MFPKAQRLLEYQEGMGYDIANTGIFRFQCKNKQQYVSVNTIDEIPVVNNTVRVVVTKANRKDSMVIMSFDDLLSILENVYSSYLTEGKKNEKELQL